MSDSTDSPPLDLLLTATDVSDAPWPLRASVRLAATPAASDAVRAAWARAALESTMGFAQDRYGIPRALMPSRQGAVEEGAGTSLAFTLKQAGYRLDVFELLALVHASGPEGDPKDRRTG